MRAMGRRVRIPTRVRLAPELYEADFRVLEKFQSFSQEMLRLAAGGIGGVGALITLGDPPLWSSYAERAVALNALSLSLVSFGVAAISSLLHRQCSSFAMLSLINEMKFEMVRSKLAAEYGSEPFLARLKEELQNFDRNRRMANICLKSAAVFLIYGAIAAAAGFVALMLPSPSWATPNLLWVISVVAGIVFLAWAICYEFYWTKTSGLRFAAEGE